MHKEAVEKEALHRQSVRNGGIVRAFEKQVTAQRNAVVGGMKLIYWLAKEEVAHTTKYESLDLAISLGCNYLKKLHVTDNATYRSRQIVRNSCSVCPARLRTISLQRSLRVLTSP